MSDKPPRTIVASPLVILIGFGLAWILATTISTAYLWNRGLELTNEAELSKAHAADWRVSHARVVTEINVLASVCFDSFQDRNARLEAYIKRLGVEKERVQVGAPPPFPLDEVKK